MRAHLALVCAGLLFGTTFLVVKDAVADVGPVPFLAARFLFGTVALLPFALRAPRSRGTGRAGVVCGLALLAGYVFQTIGLQYTESSISAFITYLLIVFVPVLSAVRLRRPPQAPTVIGVLLACVGLWLLTGARPSMGRGELLTLGCAVAFAVHIVVVADHAPGHNWLRLNMVQLATVGLICLVPGFFLGGYHFTARAWLAAVFTGVAVSGIGLGVQIWAQARIAPSKAALILTLEPVFAAVLGHFAGEHLGAVAMAGAALILLGVLVSELAPWPRALQPEAPS